jgi:hypothetical protein
MQFIKAIKPIIISEKKNALMATSIITDKNAGSNTIDNAAIEDMIVPIIPTKKQVVFLLKHFDKILGAVTAAGNTPAIKMTSDNTPKPNAIHAEVTMPGIRLKANNIAMIAPNITLITIPKPLNALKEQLSSQCSKLSKPPFIF